MERGSSGHHYPNRLHQPGQRPIHYIPVCEEGRYLRVLAGQDHPEDWQPPLRGGGSHEIIFRDTVTERIEGQNEVEGMVDTDRVQGEEAES